MANEPQHQGGASPPESGVPRTRLDEVTEPGAYVCRETGDLIRVASGGAPSGAVELLEKAGSEAVFVTQISDDPFIPISRARIAAANLDVEIRF